MGKQLSFPIHHDVAASVLGHDLVFVEEGDEIVLYSVFHREDVDKAGIGQRLHNQLGALVPFFGICLEVLLDAKDHASIAPMLRSIGHLVISQVVLGELKVVTFFVGGIEQVEEIVLVVQIFG